MDGEISDFDVQHFCAGNPVYCYYHRTPQKQVRMQQKDALKDMITHLFTTPSRTVEVETRRQPDSITRTANTHHDC